jgi:hypothetical protein
MVTIEAAATSTVVAITVTNGEHFRQIAVHPDELDDLGVVGLVRRIAAMLEEVQRVAE